MAMLNETRHVDPRHKWYFQYPWHTSQYNFRQANLSLCCERNELEIAGMGYLGPLEFNAKVSNCKREALYIKDTNL